MLKLNEIHILPSYIYHILQMQQIIWSIEILNATKKEYEKSDFFANMFSNQTNIRKKSL